MSDEPSFTLDQAMRAQAALRAALGLGPERFPLPALIGMISDEIEQMRAAGHDDAEIAGIVRQQTGVAVGEAELRRYYAPPDARARPA